jgi:hypothetical protein
MNRTPWEFVERVREELRGGATCIMFADASPFTLPSMINHDIVWPEMKRELFRTTVSEFLIRDAAVKSHKFSPPDDLDGWTFSAYPTDTHQ